MDNKPVDRRIARTKKSLQDSFFKLIQEKGYENIRVLDITEDANLGRATFYLHYNDKEELLVATIKDLINDLASRYNDWEKKSPLPGLGVVFQAAADNPDHYKALLHQADGRKAIAGFFSEFVIEQLEGHINDTPLETDIFANFIIGAILQILEGWLNKDMPYPIEDIEELFKKLVYRGFPSTIAKNKLKGTFLEQLIR